MEGISQPPDYTDILRGSYLAGRAISRIIAVCPLTGTGPLYNSTTGKVKQIFKKIQKILDGTSGGAGGQEADGFRLFEDLLTKVKAQIGEMGNFLEFEKRAQKTKPPPLKFFGAGLG